ncbi:MULTISPECIES: MFS transporter [unclassified Sphingobium]|uniref:MFS transporter n=1 Tax=unclassified Sphingobium TaxID=2611147 RepID=UPI000D150F6A|nr:MULTISPECIES: MFS transporter [unclassified Sphingobium]MBG6119981.1 putative MFS family arabinose efflux permease [Sphingobium sp. JAI105]PSO11852.1 MFS transporter [Sphingobium sp. AEW4]TWC99580.1 sugar phosphate permease [Sphingobium sp. AEW010]TWD18983.1 sugar phosphate permease [Sphingobium sp. AEW013]TWD21854.1 sugar phosphate permease [Sphingobium sp. AEW001]
MSQHAPSQLSVVIGEWRQSWRPGVAALVGGAVSYSLWSAVSSLFIEPLQAAFGWSRGEIALVHAFGIATAFAAPVIGALVDRRGARTVLTIGLCMTAALYLAFATMTGSLTQYYITYFLFSATGYTSTGITFTRIISGSFEKSRGSALAIARAGLAISGAIMPLLLHPVLDRFGLPGGYILLAAFLLFVALPLTLLWVPGRTPPAATGTAPDQRTGRWRLLVREPKIRVLTLAALLNYMPVVTLLSQMKPLAVDKGLSAGLAVGAVSMMGLAAAAGALLSGVLVDRFWAPAVAFVLNALPAIGCLFLLQSDVPPILFYGAVLLIGVGQGAEIDIVAFMIARYFGLRDYGAIYGLTTLGIALAVALGASLIGHVYDLYHSYDPALIGCSLSFALAAFMYLAMGRYPKETAA